MATANSTRTFNNETVARIRDALLIGLASYGEIECLSAPPRKSGHCGGSGSKGKRRVIHPTGASDTVSRFADALQMLS